MIKQMIDRINPYKLFLVDGIGAMNSAVMLGLVLARFEKIFGKKASTNLLRHSYLTKLYGHHIEESKKMDNTATAMGTSSHMVKEVYIKK